MITLFRSTLLTFATVLKRAGILNRRFSTACLTIQDNADGLFLRAATAEAAVEYRQLSQGGNVTVHLPLEVLARWEGKKNEPLSLEVVGADKVHARWSDGGVPRQTEEGLLAKPKVPFPAFPTEWSENDPELWAGLGDAVAATDPNSSRFALGCVHLRADKSRIEATDGHHVFTHAGYRFPFTGNELLPASKLLGYRELVPGESFGIGLTGKSVAFRVGDWRVMFPLQKEGRFPRIDDVIPVTNFKTSRLTLSSQDAKFLEEALPRLPCDDLQHHSVTMDLNGQVLIRSRDKTQAWPTELDLLNSRFEGQPLLLQTNRRFLLRALKLGFREIQFQGADVPALCTDDRRQFLWMLLGTAGTIPKQPDSIRLSSDRQAQPRSISPHSSKDRSPMPKPEPIKTDKNRIPPVASTDAGPPVRISALEQARVLRDTLRVAFRQASEMYRSLQRRQKQNRLMESTLASLQQLKSVAC